MSQKPKQSRWKRSRPWRSRTGGIVGKRPKPGRQEPWRSDVRERARGDDQLPSAKTPPRNAPCPCGSTLKFKRCCGRPR